MSAPPSPYLVKNPVTASAAWSVPTTSSPPSPAIAYCATIRMRALTLPLPKSLSGVPRRLAVLLGELVDRLLDVEDDGLLRADVGQCGLCVDLVALHAVGQANGDEPRGVPFGDELVDGHSAQEPRERGVLATADAEHESLRAGRAKVRLQEVDPGPHLLGGVDDRA